MKLHHLYEAKGAKTDALMSTMVAYLEKKLGVNLIRIPGVEHFHNSKGSGYGLRYVFDGSTKSLRFNWGSEGAIGSATKLDSIDYWDGSSHDPSFNISASGVSLVQVLPSLVKQLSKPKVGTHKVFAASPKEEAMAESVVAEAKRGDFSAEDALSDFLGGLQAGRTMTRSEFIGNYHISNVGVFDTIMNEFADRFQIDGKRVSGISPKVKNVEQLQKQILGEAGELMVSTGGSKETYSATPAEKEVAEKVPFVETLDHLDGLVRSLTKGAFNALFVAGKGGTGKTQTVEDALHDEGLMDGAGYFKNTGTASAAGMYTLLYHHRNDIVLFDDSDGALGDIDARNILKAATDTKKVRKLVWSKKSSFIFDPESEDPERYEDDPLMAPKYFDFKGRIIFISNLSLDKLDPDGALRTRAFVINVDPTDEELFDRMGQILHKVRLEEGLSMTKEEREHVLDIVKKSKRKGDVSLRKLVRALNLAASGAPNWERLVDLYA